VAVGRWDWTAKISAELVLTQRCYRGQKPVLRIEYIVANVIVSEAMKLVRSRARDDVDDTTGGAAELSVEVARQDAKLLEGIGIWNQTAAKLYVSVEGAIKIKSRTAGDAVDRELGAGARSPGTSGM